MPKTHEIERHLLQPFLPENARLLMLGSFPPPQERWCMDFFYPNPQNDMWRIMGQIFFGDKQHFVEDRVFKHEEIVSFCRKQGIAIFDTAQAVRRLQGNAADEHLEIVEQTDIAALLQQIPHCHDICCTGGKAAETLAEILHTPTPKVGEYVETNFANRTIRFWRMPSTSRAYPLSFDKKTAAYQRMFNELPKRRIEVVAAVIFDKQGRIFATHPSFHLTMHCFRCKLADSHVTLLEHEAAKWLTPNELQSVHWLPADEDLIAELACTNVPSTIR